MSIASNFFQPTHEWNACEDETRTNCEGHLEYLQARFCHSYSIADCQNSSQERKRELKGDKQPANDDEITSGNPLNSMSRENQNKHF